MLDLSVPSLHPQTLEPWVRAALISGELTPAMEAQIDRLVALGNGSADVEQSSAKGVGQCPVGDHRRLLDLLHDAIQDGCIRRVQPSE